MSDIIVNTVIIAFAMIVLIMLSILAVILTLYISLFLLTKIRKMVKELQS